MVADHPSLVRAYRSAIVLHNIGVSLLKQHAYAAAGATLRQAIELCKAVHGRRPLYRKWSSSAMMMQKTKKKHSASCSEAASASVGRLVRNDARALDELRKRATKIVYDIQKQQTEKSDPSRHHGNQASMPLQVIHLEKNDSLSSVEEALCEGPSSAIGFVMHMQVPDVGDDDDDASSFRLRNRDLDLEGAIMIQNYALCLLCQSKSSQNSRHHNNKSAADLMGDARRMFKTVFSVLMATRVLATIDNDNNNYYNYGAGAGAVVGFTTSKLVLVEIIVVSNIMAVSTASGKPGAARKFYDGLVHLRERAMELEEEHLRREREIMQVLQQSSISSSSSSSSSSSLSPQRATGQRRPSVPCSG